MFGKLLCKMGIHDTFTSFSIPWGAWKQDRCTRCDWKGELLPTYARLTLRREIHKAKIEYERKLNEERG